MDIIELVAASVSGEPGSLEETARLILSTATSASSSVSVNYLIPLLLLAIPLGYFFFRLGLFSLDDTLGMSSGVNFSGYNAPSAGYGAPAPSYGAPSPSYNSNSPSSGLTIPNSGAYLTSKEDDQINLEYINQINDELDQLRRIRDLLQTGGGRISLAGNDEILIHPSPRIDVSQTWNGLPGL